jgi:hypothetical protein
VIIRFKNLPRSIAILYASWLGTVGFFVACCLLILVGVAVPKSIVYVSFISQTVIQLLSLPAIQLQSAEAEKQRQQDHGALMELASEMREMLIEVHKIAKAEGVE